MKKTSLILVCILFAFVLAFSGCSSNQPAQTPPQQQDQTTEPPAESENTFTLVYSDWAPENDNLCEIAAQAAVMLEERSNGRIKMETHYGGSLLAQNDVFAGVTTGVADIVRFSSTMTSGVLDLNQVFNRLFEVESPDMPNLGMVYSEMLTQVPELQQEMEQAGARWLAVRALLGNNLHTAGKVVRVPDDVKGMKILCVENSAAYISSLGGEAVTAPQAEFYTNLERGPAEGELTNWSEIDSYNHLEVLKYHTLLGKNGTDAGGMGYLINLDTWNSLPADLRQLVAEVYQWATDEGEKADLEAKTRIEAEALEKGNTLIVLTPEEMQLWRDYMKPVNDVWVQETEAKGLPAQKAIDELFKLFEEYR